MNTKIYILLLFAIVTSFGYTQTCGNKKYCEKDLMGEGFDYRGQSTYGKLIPGDTSRVKIVLYSKNIAHILVCGEDGMPGVQFRILKSIREYNRVVDRIEKTVIEEPIYRTYDDGGYVQKYDDWGEPEVDEYGDPVFEIAEYKEITKSDTVWRTERIIKEEEIYNSEKADLPYFEEAVKKTKSVIIEVVVAGAEDKKEGCIAILVGRKFFSSSYNSFSPTN